MPVAVISTQREEGWVRMPALFCAVCANSGLLHELRLISRKGNVKDGHRIPCGDDYGYR